MQGTPVHVEPDGNFDHWIVRDVDGRELCHYPTREAAELVAQALARERRSELIIRLPDGRTMRKSFARNCVARVLRR